MASIIEAFVAYGPRLKRRPTVRLDELTKHVSTATGLRSSEVKRVLDEVHEALLQFGQWGAGVELPGIGTFAPSIKGDGELVLLYRTDRKLREAFNNIRSYKGEIQNRENIGLSMPELKTLWDADHPDDPLVLTTPVDDAA